MDVYRKLSTISTLKSAGPDLIPNWVLKSVLALPINSVHIEPSNQQSFVSTIWKRTNVIPIQKGKCLSDINTDLCPISLTPTMAKICKRLVADWLMKLIMDQIDERQYGSLKRSSTTHALMSFIHYLLNRSDKPKYVIGISSWILLRLLII